MEQYHKRSFDLNFNCDFIKSKIDEICKVSTGSYSILDKNDLIGIYRISTMRGLNVGIMSISINKIDENKSNCIFEIMNASGSKAPSAILSGMQDEFLNILTKALQGEPITIELIKSNKSGCLGIMLLMIVISTILMSFMILYSCRKDDNFDKTTVRVIFRITRINDEGSGKTIVESNIKYLRKDTLSRYGNCCYSNVDNYFNGCDMSLNVVPKSDYVNIQVGTTLIKAKGGIDYSLVNFNTKSTYSKSFIVIDTPPYIKEK